MNNTGLTRPLGRHMPRNRAPTDGTGISRAGCWYRRGITKKRVYNFVKKAGAQHLSGVPWPAEDQDRQGHHDYVGNVLFSCLIRVRGLRVFDG